MLGLSFAKRQTTACVRVWRAILLFDRNPSDGFGRQWHRPMIVARNMFFAALLASLTACGGGGGGGSGTPGKTSGNSQATIVGPITSDAPSAIGGVTAVTFNATCSGGVAHYSYVWFFGDGSSSGTTAGSVSHVFSQVGTLTVSVGCTDSNGGTVTPTATRSFSVSAPVPSLASLQSSPSYPATNSPTALSVNCVSPLSVPLSYAWSFGDGTSGAVTTSGSTNHLFPTAGSYSVSVVCTDTTNSVSSAATTMTLAVGAPAPSISSAVAALGNATTAIPTTLTVGCSGPGVFTYVWNFGDGTPTVTSSSGTVVHQYGSAGSYTVQVQCDDGSGTPVSSSAGVPVVVPSMLLHAGHPGGPGFADMVGSDARFETPRGVVADAVGNLFIGDLTRIRKIDTLGQVSTLAGSFRLVSGLAIDGAGNLYVADQVAHSVSVVSPSGNVTLLAGKAGVSGSTDSTVGTNARFNSPNGIARDSAGNLYVADDGNSTVRMISPQGAVSTIAGTTGSAGWKDATGTAAQFFGLRGIAVDSTGNLYVAESACDVRKIAMPGAVVSTIAGSPGNCWVADGSPGHFHGAYGLAFDGVDNLYVTDYGNLVRKVVLGATAAQTQVTTVAGTGVAGFADGTTSTAQFNFPQGLTVASSGMIYVADTFNNSIRSISLSSNAVSTVAGAGNFRGLVDAASATNARFSRPAAIAVDGAGDIYVLDAGNNNVRVVSRSGLVSILAGSALGSWGNADGVGTQSSFTFPTGIALDAAGNVYVSDTGNNTLRKITQPGAVVSTLTGTGTAAQLDAPGALAIDSAGNIYVAEPRDCDIRKVTPGGVVSTFAGNRTTGCYSYQDGPIASATFGAISGLAFGPDGSLYVSESDGQVLAPMGARNNAIRKISPAGQVTTLAGGPGLGGFADGQGSSARFYLPSAIVVDAFGMIYVADSGNHAVRKISPTGFVQTVAGTPGVSSVISGALPGYLNTPSGLAAYGFFDLYVTSTNENSILDIRFYP